MFVNGTTPAPDSNSRIDAELLNDLLAAVVAIETTLGAQVQGTFGSLAARLNQFLPGAGGLPGIFTFTQAEIVAIAGTTHNVGQAALLFKLYDANLPAQSMAPGSFTVEVDAATYDVVVSFATPTDGLIALGATSPIYLAPFVATSTVTVLGTTHNLGSADLLFQVYDTTGARWAALDPGSFTIDPDTFDVVVTFSFPLTGVLVLAAGGPTYATNFTFTAPPYTLSIPGTVHRLGTRALLFQAYDASDPRQALADPGVTVDPNNYNVVITFTVPIAGRLVLMPATTLTGQEFDIRNAGTINTNAVRLFSGGGHLWLQAGLGEHILFLDKLGAIKMVLNTLYSYLGIGAGVEPTHTLQLHDGDAVMPGGGPWKSPSDGRQKADVQAFTDGLETILALEPISFAYNGLGGVPQSRERYVGLVAQAVQSLAPYLVKAKRGYLSPEEPQTDLLSLDTGPILFLLVNAVKTLYSTFILDLLQRQQRLEQQVATLAAQLAPPALPTEETP